MDNNGNVIPPNSINNGSPFPAYIPAYTPGGVDLSVKDTTPEIINRELELITFIGAIQREMQTFIDRGYTARTSTERETFDSLARKLAALLTDLNNLREHDIHVDVNSQSEFDVVVTPRNT